LAANNRILILPSENAVPLSENWHVCTHMLGTEICVVCSDDGDVGLEDLQRVLQQVMAAKKDAAKKKQAAILQVGKACK
jgi:hypothetical protein